MKNKMIFKEAKRRFFQGGKMLESMLGFAVLIFSFVFSLMAADLIRTFGASFGLAESAQTTVLYAVLFVLLVTVSMPTLVGYMKFLYAIYNGERDVSVGDVFDSFTSPRRYIKSIVSGVCVLFRLLLIFGVPFFVASGIYFGAVEASGEVVTEVGEAVAPIVIMLLKAVSVVVFFVLYILALLLSSEGYIGLYGIVMGADHPYKQSRKMLRGKIMKTFSLKLIFLLTIVVSLLSIGSLFLVTAPIMANAYFIYAEQLTEKIND